MADNQRGQTTEDMDLESQGQDQVKGGKASREGGQGKESNQSESGQNQQGQQDQGQYGESQSQQGLGGQGMDEELGDLSDLGQSSGGRSQGE